MPAVSSSLARLTMPGPARPFGASAAAGDDHPSEDSSRSPTAFALAPP